MDLRNFETTNTGAVVTGILTATTFSGNLTGNVTGDLTGNLAGISSIAAISSSISDTALMFLFMILARTLMVVHGEKDSTHLLV